MAATTLAISAGNNQIGTPEAALPVDLAVLVTDASGDPVAGVTVDWIVGSGGGTLSAPSSVSDADGIATVEWTMGEDTGPVVVIAESAGLTGSPLSFLANCAIVSVQNVKDYLRIETDAEDALIAELILEATGNVESMVGPSLTHRSVTWYDDAQTMRLNTGVTNLMLKFTPINESTLVVTDTNNEVVPADSYTIRQDEGLVKARTSNFTQGPAWSFSNGPYKLTCVAGYDTSPTYAGVELPMIKSLLVDYTAFLWQQRTLGTSSEQASGTTVNFVVDEATGLPDRVARNIRRLRGIVYGR